MTDYQKYLTDLFQSLVLQETQKELIGPPADAWGLKYEIGRLKTLEGKPNSWWMVLIIGDKISTDYGGLAFVSDERLAYEPWDIKYRAREAALFIHTNKLNQKNHSIWWDVSGGLTGRLNPMKSGARAIIDIMCQVLIDVEFGSIRPARSARLFSGSTRPTAHVKLTATAA